MRRERIWLTAAAIALAAGLLAAPQAQAIRLDDTAIFIEINDTDGDAGIQLFLDGEGWDTMQVRDPNGNVVLGIAGQGSIGAQGITELFFESAEPSFEEQTLEELLALFPEGFYQFRGRTTDGVRLRGSARLTHAIPEAPVIVFPGEEEEDVDPEDLVIEWLPVDDPPGSRIAGYRVIVGADQGNFTTLDAEMPRRATQLTVPPEFLRANKLYKVEVLAVERSGNQTITEHEFTTGPRGGGD